MNKEITFQMSCNYIYAAKQCCLFFNEDLTKERLLNFAKNQVLITEEEKDQYIVFSTDEGYIEYRFEDNAFVKKRVIPSLKVYEEFSPKGAVYQVDLEKLQYFLLSNNNTLSTIHEEIDFELAVRLRNSFFSSSDVVYVMFLWKNGTILLCEKSNDEDVFSLTHQQENIKDQNALEKIREELGNVPCTLKVLRSKPDNEEDIELEIEKDDMSLDNNMIVEMDIPRSKVNLSLGEESSIVTKEDSIVTLDEPLPPLTSGDMEILQRYGIDTIKKKDLHKGILEGSVVIRDEELPQLGPDDIEVLKKYGISIPTDKIIAEDDEGEEFLSSKPFVFEESQIPLDEELPSLGHDEVEIFKKYGVEINNEKKNTPRIIREAFEDSVISTDKELPPIGPEDIHILQRYGISFSPEPPKKVKKKTQAVSAQTPQKTEKPPVQKMVSSGKIPQPQKAKEPSFDYKKWLQKNLTQQRIKMVAIAFLLLLVLFIGMSSLVSYNRRQGVISECDVVKKNLNDHREQIDSEIKNVIDMIAQIKEKYPIRLGYPEPSPKISVKLDEISQQNAEIRSVIQQANTTIDDGKEEEALKNLKEKHNIYTNIDKKNATLTTIQNLKLKVSHTMSMAEYMYNIRTQEALVRRVLRRLRENTILFSQLFKTLDEKLNVLKEQYPPAEGYPELPQGSVELASEVDQKVNTWTTTTESIENALLNEDNITKALELSKPYQEMQSPDGSNLKNMIDSVENTLRLCQEQAIKKAKKKEYFAILETVKKNVEVYEQELKALNDGLAVLNGFAPELSVPQVETRTIQIKTQAEQEVESKKSAMEKSRGLIYENEFDQAITIIKAADNNNVLISLKEVRENVSDTVKIAQNMKEKSEKGARVAVLLQKVKRQLLPLEDLSSQLDNQINFIRSNFEPNRESKKFSKDSRYHLSSAQQLVKNLNGITESVNLHLGNGQIENAISILESVQSLVPQASSKIEKIKSLLEEADTVIKKSEQIKYEQEQLVLVKNKTNKIREYLSQLKEYAAPLEKNINTMETRYPASEGYTEIPETVKQKLITSKNLVAELEANVEEAKELSASKNWDEAHRVLDASTTQDKLDAEFLAEISKYRYETEDMVSESSKIGKNKSEVAKIKDALETLRSRRNTFKEIIGTTNDIIKDWDKKYPAQKSFFPYPEETNAILKEANIEYTELEELVVDGEEYLHSGEYGKGVSLLDSYIRDVPSVLPAAQTAWDNLQKTIDKNQRILSDPDYQKKIAARREQEKILEKIQQEWQKSPGPWYDNIQYYLNIYDDIEPKMRGLLEPKARRFYPYVEPNIGAAKRIMEEMGELGVLIYELEQKKGKSAIEVALEKQREPIDQKSKQELDELIKLLKTRTLEIEVDKLSLKLSEGVNNLRNIVDSSQAVSDEDLKAISNSLRLIKEKFKESYNEISSQLLKLNK